MALLCDPDLLIADEPTAALDVTIEAQILDLLQEIRHTLGTSIIIITHDLRVVVNLCERGGGDVCWQSCRSGGCPYALQPAAPSVHDRVTQLDSDLVT